MAFKLFDQLLGKKETSQELSTEDLLKQIMQPSVICDFCFYEGRESEVVVKGSHTKCHRCDNELEKILINENGAQLAFYLPAIWSQDQRNTWVQNWKKNSFPS